MGSPPSVAASLRAKWWLIPLLFGLFVGLC